MDTRKRKNTRNKVWPETEVHLKYRDKLSLHANSIVHVTAGADNLSANGIFVLTDEKIPTRTEVDIRIDFQPGDKQANFILAKGLVIRQDDRGVAIQFTDIDTHQLGECIMAKLNSKK
jgi:hypothetical protein